MALGQAYLPERTKITAAAVWANGTTKLVNVKNQDGITKILDMVPDFVNKFTSKNEKAADLEPEAKEKAKEEMEQMLSDSVKNK